jgi:hypothetical protein
MFLLKKPYKLLVFVVFNALRGLGGQFNIIYININIKLDHQDLSEHQKPQKPVICNVFLLKTLKKTKIPVICKVFSLKTYKKPKIPVFYKVFLTHTFNKHKIPYKSLVFLVFKMFLTKKHYK